MEYSRDRSPGVLISFEKGVGSFLTLTFNVGNSSIECWIYQCYWEIKNSDQEILITSVTCDLKNIDHVRGHFIGSILKSFSSSPEFFEISTDKFSMMCIAQSDNIEDDDIAVRIYVDDVHLMDVRVA